MQDPLHPNTYYVYILSNLLDTVLYIGVTNNLSYRLAQHKEGTYDGFTKKYHVHKLVYYEIVSSIESAIAREKQLKKWSREKKEKLIERMNTEWKDLGEGQIYEEEHELGV